MELKDILYKEYVKVLYGRKTVAKGQVYGPMPYSSLEGEPPVYKCHDVCFFESDIKTIEVARSGVIFIRLNDGDPVRITAEGAPMARDYSYVVPWGLRRVVEDITGTRGWGKPISELAEPELRSALLEKLKLALTCNVSGW